MERTALLQGTEAAEGASPSTPSATLEEFRYECLSAHSTRRHTFHSSDTGRLKQYQQLLQLVLDGCVPVDELKAEEQEGVHRLLEAQMKVCAR
jgi:hypothetical protein